MGSGRKLGRGAIINTVLVLAILAVAGMSWWVMRGDDTAAASSATTTEVTRGDVVASVTASGNVASATDVAVDFEGTGGTVTGLYVQAGDKVKKGQILAEVDATEAKQTLRSARIQLQSAQASYAETVAGQTSAEKAVDQSSLTQAQRSVSQAIMDLNQTRATARLNRSQQNSALARAQKAVTDAEQALAKAQKNNQTYGTSETAQGVQTARTALSQARSTLVTTRQQRASALLSDNQQIAQRRAAVTAAREQLTSTRASIALNGQGATDSQIASARAQVDTAQVTVDQAQDAVDQTVLRAPAAGTIAAVNGAVGESSSGSSTSSSASSSSASSSTTSTSSDASGFITLVSTDVLEVTTYVAEADIDDVDAGQSATITLSASGTELPGTVSSVDTVQTVTNNVVEYGVTVRLDQTKGVRLGQTAEVVITTGEKDDVLRVATSALTTIGDRTSATLQNEDGTTESVAVEVGLAGDSQTQVISGLDQGDVVVVPQTDSDSSELTFPAGGPGGGGFGGMGQ